MKSVVCLLALIAVVLGRGNLDKLIGELSKPMTIMRPTVTAIQNPANGLNIQTSADDSLAVRRLSRTFQGLNRRVERQLESMASKFDSKATKLMKRSEGIADRTSLDTEDHSEAMEKLAEKYSEAAQMVKAMKMETAKFFEITHESLADVIEDLPTRAELNSVLRDSRLRGRMPIEEKLTNLKNLLDGLLDNGAEESPENEIPINIIPLAS